MRARVLPPIKRLDECFRDFLVRLSRPCAHPGMPCSRYGGKAAEVIAVARPSPVTVRKSIAINATFDGNHYFLTRMLLARGDFEAALNEIQREVAADAKAAGLAMTYHGLRRKEDSDAALARLVGTAGETWPYSVATVYAFRGERDKAFEWLEKGLATRDSDQLEGIRGDPEFAALRGDPRYKTLLRRMNLPE